MVPGGLTTDGRGPRVLPLLWPLALLLVTILGCADDGTERPCGPVPGGRIEGVIQSGGVPVAARVVALLVAAPPGSAIRIEGEAGPTGFFRLDVPAGKYLLGANVDDGNYSTYYYSAKGPVRHYTDADTLEVRSGEDPHHVEFPFGGVQVRISGYGVPTGNNGELELWRSGTDDHWTVRGTSQSGVLSFDLGGVLPAVYRLKLRIPADARGRGVEEFWLPATRAKDLADSIRVEAGRAVLYQRSVWGGFSHLKGEVLGEWQESGGSAEVYFFDADSAQAARAIVRHDDAVFDVGLRLPEPVKMRVDIDGIQAWVGGGSFRDATLFDLRPGETIEGIRYVESALSIDVQQIVSSAVCWGMLTLMDATTRMIVARTEVRIYPDVSNLRIPNLQPGGYLLYLTPDDLLATDWIAQWYDHAGSIDEARVVTIPSEGDVVPVTMNLDRGGRILGAIETARDDDPDYYQVFVTNAASRALLGETGLDPGSVTPPYTFTAIGLPDGDYKLGVTVGYWYAPADTVWYPGTTDWSTAEPIPIRDHGDVDGIVIPYP